MIFLFNQIMCNVTNPEIRSDIKGRMESIGSWNNNSPITSEAPSVSENSESSSEKVAAEQEDDRKPPAKESAQSIQDIQASDEQSSFGESQEQQQHIDIDKTGSSRHASSRTTLGDSRSVEPKEKDTILALKEPKYRDALTRCFLSLKKDNMKAREWGNQILNDFKTEGGRFLKIERGTKAYVELDDVAALQSKIICAILL